MLSGVFRTKERKAIAVILGLIVIIMIWIIVSGVSRNEKYKEQAVMAENYLNAGSYEQAVKAYQTALAIMGSDKESMSIGLAKAYAGLDEYDDALEVLRASYQEKATETLKDMIEEISDAKMDYEFLQSISSADVYYSNEEYDKAIAEYEEAKLIKSKDITSYQGIAMAYMQLDKYDMAKDEVLEGIEVTKSEELQKLLFKINYHLLKEEYDAMIAQAEEYIYQENYEDGFAKYQAAIELMPSETAAYKAMAQIYMDQENYQAAIKVLKKGVNQTKDNEINDMLTSAAELKVAKDNKDLLLSELVNAIKDKNIDIILGIIKLKSFEKLVEVDLPVYYAEGDLSKNIGLIINKDKSIYFGSIINGTKKGIGIYFIRTCNSYGAGYYYYEGEWNSDIPNGAGKTVEVQMIKKDDQELYEDMVITEGAFSGALENGSMKKYFYKNGEETAWVEYKAKKGIPLPSDGTRPEAAVKDYRIGSLYEGDSDTGQEYQVEPQTIWGVKTFINGKG